MIKKFAGIFAFILTLSAVLPVSGVLMGRASAISGETEYAGVRMRGATGAVVEDGMINVEYDGGTVVVTGALAPDWEMIPWNYGDYVGEMVAVYTKSQALAFTANPMEGHVVEARVDGQLVELDENRTYAMIGLQTIGEKGDKYEIEFSFMEDGGEPGPGMGLPIEGCDDRETGCHADLVEDLGDTVLIRVSTLWHMRFVGAVTINGVDYAVGAGIDPIDYDDQESYLNHYDHQIVGFNIEVPKDANDEYVISAEVERSEHVWIGNFLWTADPEQKYERDEDGEIIYDEDGNPVEGRDYIGNSSIDLLEVEYTVGGVTYGCSARDEGMCWKVTDDVAAAPWEWNEDLERYECSMEDDGCWIPYIEFDSRGEEEFDDGSLVVPSGARITLRVIPNYGYQVLNVNMAELEVSEDGVGEFTFTVPEGAAYFVADVVERPDVVNVESEKVKGGEIELGAEQTSLGQGTARLDVSDVELGEDEIKEFGEAAEGYELKSYLNISLYNVVYKGTEDEAWESQVKDLNEEATITLQLEEGVDGNEVVIVHQKDDGSYEVIPAEYDAESNTLTFKTASFSNYAIASRTVETPETGRMAKDGGFAERVEMFGLGMGIVIVVGMGVWGVRRKKRG